MDISGTSSPASSRSLAVEKINSSLQNKVFAEDPTIRPNPSFVAEFPQ